jgi:putative membrane protein
VEFDVLPAVSSGLNVLTTILLVAGWLRIKRKDVTNHRRLMIAALVCSIAFLVTYVVHHEMHGHHETSATGLTRIGYTVVLTTHTVLALAVAILAPRVAWLGLKGRIERHRVLARMTLPMWLYVSVTGVAVYVMVYHLWPAARGL